MNARALLPCLTLAASVLAACSGSSAPLFAGDAGDAGAGEAGDSAPAITTDQAAADAAAAYCNRAAACAPLFISVTFGDAATCAATFKSTLARAFAAPGANETAAQLEACAAAIPAVSCPELFGRKRIDACKPVPGTLEDGAPCGADGQCKSTRCRVAKNQVCGTCGAHSAPGASCGVDDDCDYGAKCLAQTGTCVPYADEGATCDPSHPCRPDLGCNSGVCGTPSGAGTACTVSEQCDQLHGVFCSPTTKQCEVAALPTAGASCGLVGGKLALCSGNGVFCAGISAPNYVGTCLPPAPAGGSCDTVNGPICAQDTVCACAKTSDAGCTGACTVPDPAACH